MEQLIFTARRQSGSRKAFTLIELLVVLLIVISIMAMTTPAVSSLLESLSLSTAGQTLVGQIDLARQTASTSGQTLQVRLLRLGTSAVGYDAIQIGRIDLKNNWIPLGRLARLPRSAVISENKANVSPLLAAENLVTGSMSAGGVSNAPFVAFSIRPSGVVEPATAAMTSFFLGIVPSRAWDSTSPPANFVFVQINPETGNTLIYRP